MAVEQNKIERPHVLLCEGADALYFLICFLNKAITNKEIAKSFQVFDFKGITELCPYLETLQNMNGYQNVKAIGVIRDAETDYESAIKNICNAFKMRSLTAPSEPFQIFNNGNISTGFVLFPSCSDTPVNGTLEDLCLDALRVADDTSEILQDVDSILDKYPLRRKHKNRLHGYFSFTDSYVGLKIGEACKANAFDVTSPALKSLRNFLLKLANAEEGNSLDK